MKAYKGFNKDMTCRGFQFREGETYHEETAELCNSGFHACEAPIDCFRYYNPKESVYREVELEDVAEDRGEDSKICGKTIKIGAEIGIPGLVKAQFEFRKANATTEHTDPKSASAGASGAASAGEYGAAVSRGSAAVGVDGIAAVRVNDVKVKGGLGAVLLLAEENRNDYKIASWKAVVVDGEKIKPDTWYKIEDGELVAYE